MAVAPLVVATSKGVGCDLQLTCQKELGGEDTLFFSSSQTASEATSSLRPTNTPFEDLRSKESCVRGHWSCAGEDQQQDLDDGPR